jgi:hypothetical protein
MKPAITFLTAAALLAAGSAQAASVDIRDAVARVTVVPEDRADVKVDVIRPNDKLPLRISTIGDRTIVDGDLDHRIRNCNHMGEKAHVSVRGVGDVDYADMPQIVVHAPKSVVISTSGAVQGAIGRSGDLELHNSGCSAWTIADVAGEAEIHESGAGSIHMGQSDRLSVQLSGAANIHATRVRKALDARLSGAGNIKIDDLQGELGAQVSGVGQVHVGQGQASLVKASVSGIGTVAFDGVAHDLDASISGLGSVRVNEVTGSVSKSVSGGGSVQIGKRDG